MDKLIGILFGLVASVIDLLGSTAVAALAAHPCVTERTIEDIATLGRETSDAILATGILGTIDGTAREMGGQFRDGNAEHLMTQNVIDALAAVRHLRLQPPVEPLDNLTEEYARLRHWVEKSGCGRREQLLRQEVKH
ncbi:MAG: hypothetical protein K2H04_00050, partial [Bacteroidaceae bacterium]|nr:hypothetical protein [Bacteroidaceae bacterium]